jgi:hypothetical protein
VCHGSRTCKATKATKATTALTASPAKGAVGIGSGPSTASAATCSVEPPCKCKCIHTKCTTAILVWLPQPALAQFTLARPGHSRGSSKLLARVCARACVRARARVCVCVCVARLPRAAASRRSSCSVSTALRLPLCAWLGGPPPHPCQASCLQRPRYVLRARTWTGRAHRGKRTDDGGTACGL